MGFSFFENGVQNNILTTPNDYFREQQQAFITQEWENTSARYTIKEQSDFGSEVYNDIEVWIDYVVGLGSRGTTNGDDFRQILFESITHEVKRGLYYQFDDNYWITYFTDNYSSLTKDVGVRRCNNVMRIIDPENGSIFSAPCVIDYDMASPSQQVSRYVITPNNHATVMVQGNEDTLRLFKLNTRYIFGGRPFKLLAYQNTLIDESISNTPTLLYLDLYLDEIHPEDDIENQLASNGNYVYSVSINSDDMDLVNGSTGQLTATVTLNGKEIDKEVTWISSNENYVQIDNQGNFNVVGKDSGSCLIVAEIVGNSIVKDSIHITIVDEQKVTPKIVLSNTFNKVRQYETLQFYITVNYGAEEINPDNIAVSLSEDEEVLSNDYVTLTVEGNLCSLTGIKINKNQNLYIKVQNNNPEFESFMVYSFDVVSMMG